MLEKLEKAVEYSNSSSDEVIQVVLLWCVLTFLTNGSVLDLELEEVNMFLWLESLCRCDWDTWWRRRKPTREQWRKRRRRELSEPREVVILYVTMNLQMEKQREREREYENLLRRMFCIASGTSLTKRCKGSSSFYPPKIYFEMVQYKQKLCVC